MLDATQTTPGPSGILALDGNANPLTFLSNLIQQYGDAVRYQTRFGPCLLFVHPDHVHTILHRENYRRASLVKMMLGDGLLASDGPRWRSQRRLMQPDFLPAAIAPFVAVMAEETGRLASCWNLAAAKGQAVDISIAMTRLTLRIIVRVLFSEDLSAQRTDDLCAAITQTINDLGNISWTIFGVPVRMTPGSNASFNSGKQVIDSVCYEMIARRRALPPASRPRDLLTLLLEADTNDEPLTDQQLRDEIVTMLVGGHETTALALAWAWKALAEHPEIERTLHQELDTVLPQQPPAIADLPALRWTKAIFQEAMRLYPPVWYMARVATEHDTIHGHDIPRGACVLVSAYFTHRHEDFWPNPESFDPARFVSRPTPQHRYAYFPFGGGRHQCLGMHLALIEGTAILAQLAQQFRIQPLAGQPIRPAPGITLRQTPSLLATVHPRKQVTT
jgi:cytochrome P450